MPFVHVENQRVFIPKGPEHGHTSKTQHNLLAEPVMFIPTIKMIGKNAIPRIVFRKICVQKQHGDLVTIETLEQILPCTHAYFSTFDGYLNPRGQRIEMVFRGPFGMSLDLVSLGIQSLLKISLAVQKRDSD